VSAVRVERFAVIEIYDDRVLDAVTEAVAKFRAEFGRATLLGLGQKGNACASVQCVKPTDNETEFAAVLIANPRGLLALLEGLNEQPAFGAYSLIARARLRTLLSDAAAEFQ